MSSNEVNTNKDTIINGTLEGLYVDLPLAYVTRATVPP